MINHMQKPIRLMKTAAMDMKSYVAIKINIVNQFKRIGMKISLQIHEKMLEEVEYCKGIVKKRFNKPLIITGNDELCFKLMDKCHICGKKYTNKDVRVRDHCHIKGKFRGSAHQKCNLKLRIKPKISRYQSSFIIYEAVTAIS